jgi:hypothetical protein
MPSAGARVLREDDNEMSREAVLLQWERKIEAAERRDDDRRFVRAPGEEGGGGGVQDIDAHSTPGDEPVPLHPEKPSRTRRFERSGTGRQPRAQAAPQPQAHAEPHPQPASRAGQATAASPPPAERRTIRIGGQPTAASRRRAVVDSQLAQPDRIALWAFLLGLLLVAVAAGTAHA